MDKTIKTIKFLESDADLVNLIEKYQKSKELKSFVSAVRNLCYDALKLKEISK